MKIKGKQTLILGNSCFQNNSPLLQRTGKKLVLSTQVTKEKLSFDHFKGNQILQMGKSYGQREQSVSLGECDDKAALRRHNKISPNPLSRCCGVDVLPRFSIEDIAKRAVWGWWDLCPWMWDEARREPDAALKAAGSCQFKSRNWGLWITGLPIFKTGEGDSVKHRETGKVRPWDILAPCEHMTVDMAPRSCVWI